MFVNDHILKYVYTYICICCMGRFCVTLCCSLDCVYAVWGYFVYLCAGWIVFVLYGVILCTFVLTHWNVFMLYEVILCTFVLAWLCLCCMGLFCVPLCWLDCVCAVWGWFRVPLCWLTGLCLCCMGLFCVPLCWLDCVYDVWSDCVYLCAGLIVFLVVRFFPRTEIFFIIFFTFFLEKKTTIRDHALFSNRDQNDLILFYT